MSEAHHVWIGYDPSQHISFEVLKYSLEKHASEPILVRPIDAEQIDFSRGTDPLASTPFTYTRFLVPWLEDYQGTALFMDSDMLALGDISELFHEDMDGLALRVRQHEYNPTETVKMGGKTQTQYPRKNWSSLMLMNCPELGVWSKEAVETESGAWLHRFEPIPDEKVGDLSEEWNVLDHMTGPTKLLHYTSGGPWLEGCEDADHADLWHEYREEYEFDSGGELSNMDGRGTFLFVFRASPDVDHMAPLAWKLLKEGDEVHAVISPGYEPEADHRLELLRGFERFHIHRIDRPAGPRWLRTARVYLRSTLPYALALLRRSGARVVAVEWGYGLPAGYDRLRSPAGVVALLRSFGRSLLKARSDPQQVRSNFIVSARVLGVPTVCLPHGLNIKFDNATNTQLLEMFESGSLEMTDRNRFDAFVFNTEFHRQWFLNHAGGDPAVMQTWGSLRWSPEWFDVNRRLAPRFEWPEDTDRVKVVFMIPKWQNRTRVEEAVDLVLRLQELDGISLALMGHPRHGRKSFGPLLEEPAFDLDRVHDVTGQSSVSLIDACDVVIDVGSSIGLEVVMQGKVLVNPAYIHEIKTVFDTIEGASVTVQSADEAVDYLRAHASGRPHEVPEEAYAELMRQMVYGSREAPFDVLEEYGSRVRALSRS